MDHSQPATSNCNTPTSNSSLQPSQAVKSWAPKLPPRCNILLLSNCSASTHFKPARQPHSSHHHTGPSKCPSKSCQLSYYPVFTSTDEMLALPLPQPSSPCQSPPTASHRHLCTMQSIPPQSASFPPSICTYATTTIHLTARFQCSTARVHHYQQQAPHCSLPAIRLPTAQQTREVNSIHTHTNCSQSSWTGLVLFLSALPKFTPNSFNSLYQAMPCQGLPYLLP